MKFSIQPMIFQQFPDFKLGIVHYTKISVTDSPQMLKGRMRLFQEHLFFDLEEKSWSDYEGIVEWRNIWKAFGADPSRYRPSMEAMMRRIKKQQYIDPVNGAVDVNNFFSLQYVIPVGLYDIEKIIGNVEITVGNEQSTYLGLNGRELTLNGIIHTKDEAGSFGSPYVDSVRTAVTDRTTDAVQVFYLKTSMHESEANELLHSAAHMFTQVNGGEFTVQLLTKNT